MKAFLMCVAAFLLLSVLAYATSNLPTPVHLRPIAQQTSQGCSPCAENLAAVLDLAGQDWERDMALFFEQSQKPSKPTAQSWGELSSARQEEAKQLFDQFRTEEGLRRLRERRGASSRDAPKGDGYSDEQPPDDSP